MHIAPAWAGILGLLLVLPVVAPQEPYPEPESRPAPKEQEAPPPKPAPRPTPEKPATPPVPVPVPVPAPEPEPKSDAPAVKPVSGAPGPVAQKAPAKPAVKDGGAPESKPALFHSRIRVVLRNGQKLLGIAKGDRLAEKAEGFDFSPAVRKSDFGAGLRIWYSNPGQNYLFIPYAEIDSVETVGRVSDLEIKQLEERAAEEARLARERDGEARMAALRARIRARDAEREAEEAAEEAARKKAEEKLEAVELAQARRLLDRFPPEQGWGEARRTEILAMKSNHLYPSPEELAFLKVYDEWVEAKTRVEEAEKETKETPDEESKKGTPEVRDSSEG